MKKFKIEIKKIKSKIKISMPDLFESLDLDKIKSNLNWDQIPIETLIELS